MARLAFAALLLACIAGVALAGPCQYVDADCKPRASAFKVAPKGAAIAWVSLLRGFESCKGKTGAACSGSCMIMPGKGCTLTPAARKNYLGSLGPKFASCTKLAPAACVANPECKPGVGSTCVIGAQGIINTFGLTTNFPGAISVLTGCKTMVANPTACDAMLSTSG